MSVMRPSDLERFHWKPQPAAQQLLDSIVNRFCEANAFAAELRDRMLAETGTRFFDWVDHIKLPADDDVVARLGEVGYEAVERDGVSRAMHHPGALFPDVIVHDEATLAVGIKVDSVIDFASANELPEGNELLGDAYSRLRCLLAHREEAGGSGDPATELWAVERRGYDGYTPGTVSGDHLATLLQHRERIVRRDRDFGEATGDYTVGGEADAKAFEHLDAILDAAIRDLGVATTCELFFEGERIYWENRNRAGQVQHLRQNRLGLGWANHDHHTYRVSRANYPRVIGVFEKLGFHCRERFYAGVEAGWGAQVLEEPVTGVVIFADVDMDAEELTGDFAHEGFEPRPAERGLGTIGMWVGLHGEAIMQAGMHHLECMFDHKSLVSQLKSEAGIETMDPFTTFPYLRQAFTEGEMFRVDPGRIDAMLAAGYITESQASGFRKDGALGSHLENLERNDGFKGFNQQGVSDIISRTDPRKHQMAGT